ncbi:MAG TPA: hypothetical protein VIY47_17280 [Ignavibacteriaceae bacterium]
MQRRIFVKTIADKKPQTILNKINEILSETPNMKIQVLQTDRGTSTTLFYRVLTFFNDIITGGEFTAAIVREAMERLHIHLVFKAGPHKVCYFFLKIKFTYKTFLLEAGYAEQAVKLSKARLLNYMRFSGDRNWPEALTKLVAGLNNSPSIVLGLFTYFTTMTLL